MYIVINHPDYKSAEWWKWRCAKLLGKEPDIKMLYGFRWQSSIEVTSRKKDLSLDEQ